MRRGQTTLEYVYLIGVAAAALFVMLIYIGRGMQGNIRASANQLGEDQYSPNHMQGGINETIVVDSTSTSVSSLNSGSLTKQDSSSTSTQTLMRQTNENIATLDKE